jgi:hypothetical protein
VVFSCSSLLSIKANSEKHAGPVGKEEIAERDAFAAIFTAALREIAQQRIPPSGQANTTYNDLHVWTLRP